MQNSNISADEAIQPRAPRMAVRRFTSSDGVKLVADECGPADAPVVILLHGGGQTRHSWARAMSTLAAQGYRVINFDARGHGDSDWSATGEYHLDNRVADLRCIVDDLQVPFALVGASLGGATIIHAIAGGMTPTAAVVVDFVPEAEEAGVKRIVDFMRASPDGFSTLEEAADAVANYNPERPRSSDPSGLMRNLRERENGRLYWHWDPRITSTEPGQHRAIIRESAAAMAHRENIPLLLVRGLRSDVVSVAGVAAFKALLPGLEVVDVGGAGHMVAGDRNDDFNAGVIDFLSRRLPVA